MGGRRLGRMRRMRRMRRRTWAAAAPNAGPPPGGTRDKTTTVPRVPSVPIGRCSPSVPIGRCLQPAQAAAPRAKVHDEVARARGLRVLRIESNSSRWMRAEDFRLVRWSLLVTAVASVLSSVAERKPLRAGSGCQAETPWEGATACCLR